MDLAPPLPAWRHLLSLLRALVGLACLLLVGTSLERLAFLVHPPAPVVAPVPDGMGAPSLAAATDAAFIRHAPLAFGHIGPGLWMVLVGPLQFSRRFRARAPRAHRWLGRSFLVASAFTACAGLVMNFVFPPSGGWLQVAVLCAAASGQLGTVWMGWRAIRAHNVHAHRIWMTRSWGIALAGGATGLVALPLYLMQGGLGPDFIGVSRLVGLVVVVLCAEVLAQRRGAPT